MSYIRREHTLEELAACVISYAAVFSEDCAQHGPIPPGPDRRIFTQTLDRLQSGNVLDGRDDACIGAIGKELVTVINSLSPGYGNRILSVDTHDDFLVDPELSRLRIQLLVWSNFTFQRNRLRARLKVKELLATSD
jgi:hypothetical protein